MAGLHPVVGTVDRNKPCKCGVGAKVRAWEDESSDGWKKYGRRYWTCYKGKKRPGQPSVRICDFFEWIDPPFEDRAAEVIKDLLYERTVLKFMCDRRAERLDEFQGKRRALGEGPSSNNP